MEQEQTNKRKLVSLRIVADLLPIEGADAIELAVVDGWKVVVKKGDFKIGDACLYFEIDSFLPDGDARWQFLVDKSARFFEGVKGHKLRTIKLRGQISQGLVLPYSAFPDAIIWVEDQPDRNNPELIDFSEVLGVKKWEAALPAQLQGQAEGLFPSFIRKTDQERCQNLKNAIFMYDDVLVPFEVANIPPDALQIMADKGDLSKIDGDYESTSAKYMKVLRAQASRDDLYEITMKLDGSSMTCFVREYDGMKTGVCSRNLELKDNEENAENTFIKVFNSSGLKSALIQLYQSTGRQIAVQGEVMGPNVQGNREELKVFKLFVFDIFDIAAGEYLAPPERNEVFEALRTLGAKIEHVPVLFVSTTLSELGLHTIDDLLKFAEGPSIKHPIREGIVFKRLDGKFSFKAISNKFLEKEKD